MVSLLEQPSGKYKLDIVIPIKAVSLKDLLKLALTPKMSGCYTPNENIYVYESKGTYIYFVFGGIKDVLKLRGLLFEYYIISDVEPKEFLWWNPKTGGILTHESPYPNASDRAPNGQKEVHEVFPIVKIAELPDFFKVWNGEKS